MKQIFLFLLILIASCTTSVREEADLLVFNAKVYTVDEEFSIVEAFVIKDGIIIETGNSRPLLDKYNFKDRIDAGGRFVYPGFTDAHCHFYGYGMNLFRVDLTATKSFKEVVEKVKEHHQNFPSDFIVGRGWDQNDWNIKSFPDNSLIDSLFPEIPVILIRVDGHAALCNSAALKRAGVSSATKIDGGIIEIDKNGKPTGILIDNAVDLVKKIIPSPTQKQQEDALLLAQKNCFEVGLTTVADAGLDKDIIELIDSLQGQQLLKMRLYAMVSASEENLNYYLNKGPFKKDRLNVCSFKLYGDGALGSRGACLLESYTDMPGHHGLLLSEPEHFRQYASKIYEKGFQMNTHCIGDSANRLLMKIYGEVLKGTNDRRWRIEHAQVVHPDDFKMFAQYNIIPSVQPTHATSDMYWAEERLGNHRIKTAYAYKKLLKQNGFVAAGSDFPVEHINPLYGFYAGVARKDFEGFPEGGFNIENALTREEALKAMTIWAALANFEENEKGSIEAGKFADFVILEKDIMTTDIIEVPKVRVLKTFINGEKVFSFQD